ncbi:hypothetical protein HMPREF1868_00101 [Olsenella sp. DNF00959]|nr:hypothetical protein HMPREF1868_00101 [Olsenella sp. DNF00959]
MGYFPIPTRLLQLSVRSYLIPSRVTSSASYRFVQIILESAVDLYEKE